MIILDTSGLLAVIDGSQHRHAHARQALSSAPPPWILSPFVLAELDYLLATRVGQAAERALLDEVGRGVYRLEAFEGRTSRLPSGSSLGMHSSASDSPMPHWSCSPIDTASATC